MGLTPPGEGERAIHEGWTARARQAAGQCLGRTEGQGPSGRRHRRLHARDGGDAAVRARAGGMQLPKAKLGGVFNMGGAAVANYVSILERLR